MKDHLRELFAATLMDLAPGPHVRAALRAHAATFALDAMDRRPSPGRAANVLVLALGKAARPMAIAALDELRTMGANVTGLLVPPEPDTAPLPPFEVIAGGHPLPTAGSLRAGARALELCRAATADTFVLVLLSGGASAMCELPLDAAITLDELRTCYQSLVGCGAGIEAVNTVRKHLSAVKGGRLAAAAAHARGVLTLAISDVPGDLAALASGPTLGDDATIADCRSIVQQFALAAALPPSLRARLEAGTLPPLISPADPRLAHGEAVRLLDNDTAVESLAHHAAAAGIHVVVVRDADEMQVDAASEVLLAALHTAAKGHAGPTAVIAGGEVRVALPAHPGRGGRNQQFALECALRIQHQPITVLSAGTDGIDGNSEAAGAIADGATVARANALGRDAQVQLGRFDAFPLFTALGDTIATGPTGTNVRDLRVLVRG